MNNNDNNNNIIIINNNNDNNNNNNNNNKVNRVLKENRGAMQDIGLHWNQVQVVQVKRGAQVLDESGMRMDETTTFTALGEGKHYKFLGVLENVRQDERLALVCAAKEYLYAGYLLYGPAPYLIVTVYRQLISMHSQCCGT